MSEKSRSTPRNPFPLGCLHKRSQWEKKAKVLYVWSNTELRWCLLVWHHLVTRTSFTSKFMLNNCWDHLDLNLGLICLAALFHCIDFQLRCTKTYSPVWLWNFLATCKIALCSFFKFKVWAFQFSFPVIVLSDIMPTWKATRHPCFYWHYAQGFTMNFPVTDNTATGKTWALLTPLTAPKSVFVSAFIVSIGKDMIKSQTEYKCC